MNWSRGARVALSNMPCPRQWCEEAAVARGADEVFTEDVATASRRWGKRNANGHDMDICTEPIRGGLTTCQHVRIAHHVSETGVPYCSNCEWENRGNMNDADWWHQHLFPEVEAA